MKLQGKGGFTLLEIMIAVFILAMSVTVLLGTQSTSTRLMGYSNNLSVITLLTRSKMQDLEYEVQRVVNDEGVKEEYLEAYSGDFGDLGYSDITWEAKVETINIDADAANDFIESVNSQLYGSGGDDTGSLSGNVAFTQFLPIMVGYMPTIINQIGQRIRKVTLTTRWEYLGKEQTLTVSEYCVILEVEAGSAASGASVSGTASGESADTTETTDTSGSSTGSRGGSRSSGIRGGSRSSGGTSGSGTDMGSRK